MFAHIYSTFHLFKESPLSPSPYTALYVSTGPSTFSTSYPSKGSPSCSTFTFVHRVSTVSCSTLFYIYLLNPLHSLYHTPSVLVYSREQFLVSCLLLQFLSAQNQACCSWLKQAHTFWVKLKSYADLLLLQSNFLYAVLHAGQWGTVTAITQNLDDLLLNNAAQLRILTGSRALSLSGT